MQRDQAMHVARLVLAEAAVANLLRQAQNETPFDTPDGIVVTLEADGGGDVTYTRKGQPVGGESL